MGRGITTGGRRDGDGLRSSGFEIEIPLVGNADGVDGESAGRISGVRERELLTEDAKLSRLETSLICETHSAINANGAQSVNPQLTPVNPTIPTAESTWSINKVLHISPAKRRCEVSQKRRRVKCRNARWPWRRSGRKRFDARDMKDWMRRAKDARRVAVSQSASSSWRVGGGG